MTKREEMTPAWLVERLAQGELDGKTAAEVRARLVAEGRSPDEAIDALARADREMLVAHPPAAIVAEIERRAARARSAPLGGRRPAFAAAFAAAALAVVLVARHGSGPSPSVPLPLETTTIKGGRPSAGAQLYVYRHATAGDRRLAHGERVSKGDLLQLGYATTQQGFGVLLSIDGAGAVTQHWPEPGSTAAALLRAGGEVRLPFAYELDDAPRFERFFLVRADRAFDVAPVIAAAHALSSRMPDSSGAPLPLPAGFSQTSLTLEKSP
jgi:hypothetical protein